MFNDDIMLAKILEEMFLLQGKDVMANKDRFYALFLDLGIDIRQSIEFNIVRRIVQENILQYYYDLSRCSSNEYQERLILIRKKLVYEYGFSNDWADIATINFGLAICNIYMPLHNEENIVSSKHKQYNNEILHFTDGRDYYGTVVKGTPHGHGVMEILHYGKYIGEFRDGKFHGEGEYQYKNGDRYVGQWMNGYKEGIGIYYYSNGDYYNGEWKKNKKYSYGTYYYYGSQEYELQQWDENEERIL